MRAAIQSALDRHLAALPGATHIAWENVQWTPPRDAIWYRPRLLSQSSRIRTFGGSNALVEERGLYQIDVYVPTTQRGPRPVNEAVDALRAHFSRDRFAPLGALGGGATMHLTGSTARPAIPTPDWFRVPVDVGYLAYYHET